MKLYDTGVYLQNGQEIIPENQADLPVAKEEAAKNTIAYSILKAHNKSDNMEKLQIKFDKLTSHDITFVGIIQTARASGLEKFPVPYVLTNCHNSLCAVGGTINEDDHMFGLTCAKKYGGVLCTASSGSYPSVCKRNACRRRKDDPRFRQSYKIRSTWNHGYGRGRTGACKTASLPDIRY